MDKTELRDLFPAEQRGVAVPPATWTEILNQDLKAEYASMLRYLELAQALQRNNYFVDYFGQEKDAAYQLLDQAMQEMRHAEMLARKMVQLGVKPEFSPSQALPEAPTFEDLLEAAIAGEIQDQQRYLQHHLQVKDNELKLIYSHLVREEASHQEMDQKIRSSLQQGGIYGRSLPPAQGVGQSLDLATLQQAVDLEFRIIVEEIHFSLILGLDLSLAPRLRALAIEDMQHLRRIAGTMLTMGGRATLTRISPEPQMAAGNREEWLGEIINLKSRLKDQFLRLSERLAAPGAAQLLKGIAAKEKENLADLQAYRQVEAEYRPAAQVH